MEKEEKEMKLQGFYIETDKKCPKCKSKKISIIETFQVYQERKMGGKKIYDKDYKRTPFSRVFHSYKCRKCGWQSINFDE